MGTLYLDRKDLQLSLEYGRLLIREPGERPRGIPLPLLERVVIQGRVGLNSALLGNLAEQGIAVVCLSGRHSRRTAFILGPGHSDARRRLAQYQLCQNGELRLAWSRLLVDGKLRAQQRLLQEALERRPDCRKPLKDGIDRLAALLPALAQATDLDILRGLEGAAASGYFSALTALFPPALNFTGRNRRPPRDPVNACLSLGYTLLHFEAVRACHGAGLDPLLGFFHEPAYGRESLACDLLEPLRPRLDAWVWELFRSRTLRSDQFVEDKGACLLNKAGRQTFYAGYEVFARPPRRYLRQQCYRLAGQLLQLAPAWIKAEEE
jgi:CRISPR-associated protein Cas1